MPINLRKGDKGEAIKQLQHLLNAHGANLNPLGNFLDLTEAAVMEFQVKNGFPKTGIVDDTTYAALVKQPVLTFNDTVLSIARSQLGMAEIPHGSNWGKHVEKYLRSVGIGFPAAWCMAFVYWVFEQACKETGNDNLLVKTGGVMRQWNECKKTLRTKTPQRGAIFIMDYGKGLGHTGIVEKVLPDGKIQTIEGNTNDDGSREGYEVARHTRNASLCKGFLYLNL